METEQIKITRSIKFQLLGSTLILLVLAMGFNALLGLNKLQKLYVESIASQYTTVGKDSVRTLENALKFGKTIQTFVGIEKLLSDTKQNLMTGVEGNAQLSGAELIISIAPPDGAILYSTEAASVGKMLPAPASLLAQNIMQKNAANAAEARFVKHQTTYIIPLPIQDGKKQWVATILIVFHEKQVNDLLTTVRHFIMKVIAVIVAASAILLLILLNTVLRDPHMTYSALKRRITIVMLLVIGGAQLVFSVVNTSMFGRYYLRINTQKASTLVILLKLQKVEFFFKKGIQIEKLIKMDAMLGEIVDESPEIETLSIFNRERVPLYMATKTLKIDFQKAEDDVFQRAYQELPVSNPTYTLEFKLHRGESLEGYLTANLSTTMIASRLVNVALDSATVLLISILFFIELLVLTLQLIERQVTDRTQLQMIHSEAIRPVTFAFMLGSALPLSFVPLYMATIYTPMFNLPKDMVLGFPVSMRPLFMGIAAMLAGSWLDRRGWQQPFLLGLLLAGGGGAYAWLAPDSFHFIISQGLTGLGYGLALMAGVGFVVAHTDSSNKAQGLTRFFAAAWAGAICGNASGAMLVEMLGYRPVFLIGGSIVMFSALYTMFFMRHAFQPQEAKVSTPSAQKAATFRQLFGFLFHREVLSLLVFSSIPATLVLQGFLYYYSPVFLKGIGTSQSNIGRIFMIPGLCAVYIAPLLSKYIDRSPNKKRYIILSNLLGSLALVSFYYIGGIAASVMAILLLGLSNSLDSSRNSYLLKLPVTQAFGSGKAMSMFDSIARIGPVLGPMIFGLFLMGTNIKGILYLGAAYCAVTVVFLLASYTRKPHTDRMRKDAVT